MITITLNAALCSPHGTRQAQNTRNFEMVTKVAWLATATMHVSTPMHSCKHIEKQVRHVWSPLHLSFIQSRVKY